MSTLLLSGELDTGKAIIRDYINATVGFEALGAATGTPPKSLLRMFGPRGDPQASNLFAVLGHLQRQAGVRLRTRPDMDAPTLPAAALGDPSPAAASPPRRAERR